MQCEVVAPTLVPVKTDQIKADRRGQVSRLEQAANIQPLKHFMSPIKRPAEARKGHVYG